MPTEPSNILQAPEHVLSTLERDGSRRWMFPRLSTGRFWSARCAVAYALIAAFTALPFLRFGGRPVLLLDVIHRRFTILGVAFLPTDTALLALLLLAALLTVFFVTALLGRVWCGWGCPQTVYMEYVFRPIERLFTGRAGRGGKPADVPAWRRVAMYAVFLLICVHLANTFLAYFVPFPILTAWITSSPAAHPAGFTIVAVVAALMMFDFCFFREQTCLIACPYGRLQSVLLDKQSLIISYDIARGEPRGKKKRVSLPVDQSLARALTPAPAPTAAPSPIDAAPAGDCVDCEMCVQVCPTGIDIRDGLQVECIACAQCIDACHDVMLKVDRPTGLIRYSSQAAMAGEPAKVLRPRVVIYSAIITLLLGLLATLLATRSPADVDVFRNAGQPFIVRPDGTIENTMRVKITNRTTEPQRYRLALIGRDDVRLTAARDVIDVAPAQWVAEPIRVVAPPAAYTLGHLKLTLRVTNAADGATIDRECRLLGPLSTATTPAAASPATTPTGAH